MTTLGQLVFSGILIGSIYALMSVGLTLIFGVLRVVNFAHGEFLMLAMYGAWAITRFLGLNAYVAIIAVVPASVTFTTCTSAIFSSGRKTPRSVRTRGRYSVNWSPCFTLSFRVAVSTT